jgi:dCTP deaminase
MYLSDKDLKDAVEKGELLCDPPPETYDPTSFDLHLDHVKEAKIWNIQKYVGDEAIRGSCRPELRIGQYKYALFADKYLSVPPDYDDTSTALVQRRVNQVIIRPGGFLLWQTKERVGTPHDAKLICFVNGKSTRARAGIVVHLTAPTIHSTWAGKITLESWAVRLGLAGERCNCAAHSRQDHVDT